MSESPERTPLSAALTEAVRWIEDSDGHSYCASEKWANDGGAPCDCGLDDMLDRSRATLDAARATVPAEEPDPLERALDAWDKIGAAHGAVPAADEDRERLARISYENDGYRSVLIEDDGYGVARIVASDVEPGFGRWLAGVSPSTGDAE